MQLIVKLLPYLLWLAVLGLGVVIRPDDWWLLSWSLGTGIGFHLSRIDSWLQPVYDTDDQVADQALQLLKQKQFASYLLLASHSSGHLISESVVFWAVFALVGTLLAIISLNPMAHGLILGWGASLVGTVIRVYASSPTEFAQRFLWQIKRPLARTEQRGLVIALTSIFIVIIGLVWR